MHNTRTPREFQRIFDQRRAAYGGMPVLLNTTSQDEGNYKDTFEPFIRYAVNNTIKGAAMIFPGQELGLRGTIEPPSDFDSHAGQPYADWNGSKAASLGSLSRVSKIPFEDAPLVRKPM
jgi:hypothetical protein